MIVDPWGTILAGGGDKEIILKNDVDRSEVASAREQFPGLAGRVDWLNIPGA
jgi:predicted amidohydrolase